MPADKVTKDTCLLCGRVETKPVYEFSRADIPAHFDVRNIVQCIHCGFTFIKPMPPDGYFQDIYGDDYWQSYQESVGEPDIHTRLDEFLEISRERINFLQEFKTTGRFLDAGCSMGFLVKAAQDAGFEAYGLDLSEKTLEEGRRWYGVNLWRGTIENYPNEQFDVIVSYNTIEHVIHPDRMISEMKRRLAPGGIIVIGTHDFECETHRKEGRRWKHIMPWEHVYYFRRIDLERLAAQCGLETFYHNKPIDNLIVTYHRNKEGL